jgi:hypothetical protein
MGNGLRLKLLSIGGNMKNTKRLLLALSAGLLLSISGQVNLALASPMSTSDSPSATTTTKVDANCELAVKQASAKYKTALPSDLCKRTITTNLGATHVLLTSELQSVSSSLSGSDYLALKASVAAGTVKSRDYSQAINNGTDSETQNGTFYYDGVRAWVTSSYRGVVGSHRCAVNWTVGYSVALQGCFESGSTSDRVLSQQWLFTPFFNGFPLSWSETYSMHVNATGQTW